MALVHHDEVEEIGRKLFVDILFLLGAAHRLVETQVDLERLVHAAVRDFRHRGAERLEVVCLRLVGKDVAIHEEEDAFFRAGFPETPNDLERRVGLAGAGGHHEQAAFLTSGNGFDRAVDGIELVVARGLLRTVVVVILRGDFFLFLRPAFGCAIAAPKFLGRRKLIQGNLAGYSP